MSKLPSAAARFAMLAWAVLAVALSTQVAAATECPSTFPQSKVKAVAIYSAEPTLEAGKKDANRLPVVGLGDSIVLTITDLANVQTQLAACGGVLVLALDSRPLSGLTPRPSTDPATNRLRFDLVLGEGDARKDWAIHLGRPDWSGRKVKVSVAPPSGTALDTEAEATLVSIRPAIVLGWAAFFVALFASFLALAHYTDVLRTPQADLAPGLVGRPQFSLSRVQASWWFFWVLASFILIGAVTGDFESALNGTALGLLGIGAVTLAGSATIDKTQPDPETRIDDGAKRLATLTANIRRNEILLHAKQTSGEEVDLQKQIAVDRKTANGLAGLSKGFLLDIVSDSSGVAFHRFQVVAWTLVLTAIFIIDVYRDLSMPTFSDTLLGLQALSAATYLGLKIPEPKPVTT